jgi:hypothetical protein
VPRQEGEVAQIAPQRPLLARDYRSVDHRRYRGLRPRRVALITSAPATTSWVGIASGIIAVIVNATR